MCLTNALLTHEGNLNFFFKFIIENELRRIDPNQVLVESKDDGTSVVLTLKKKGIFIVF